MRQTLCQHRDQDWTPILSDDTPDATFRIFQLLNEIGIINQLSSSAFEGALPHGLTVAQFSLLNHCVRLGDNWTPARLAAAFQVTKGTMTSTLKRLEAKGFVKIIPDDKDGRSKRVLLTEAGRQARAEALTLASPLFERTKAALSAEEIDTILPVMQKLREWLDHNRPG